MKMLRGVNKKVCISCSLWLAPVTKVYGWRAFLDIRVEERSKHSRFGLHLPVHPGPGRAKLALFEAHANRCSSTSAVLVVDVRICNITHLRTYSAQSRRICVASERVILSERSKDVVNVMAVSDERPRQASSTCDDQYVSRKNQADFSLVSIREYSFIGEVCALNAAIQPETSTYTTTIIKSTAPKRCSGTHIFPSRDVCSKILFWSSIHEWIYYYTVHYSRVCRFDKSHYS